MIALVIFLILASAYFSSAETAITSVGKGRLRHLMTTHGKKRRALTHLHDEPNDLITALLILNNLTTVMASSLMTVLILRFLPRLPGYQSGLIATFVMTLSLLVFSEITPKNFAKHNAERVTLATINQICASARALRPLIVFFRAVARWIGRVFGVDLSEVEPLVVTDEQIETLIDASEESGLLDEADGEMIRRILDFDEMTAEQVMIPRPDVQTIEMRTSLGEVREIITQGGHSRLPVYEEDPDNIVGTLYAKDLLSCDTADPGITLKQLVRPPFFAPATQPINVLLREFQRQKVHIAIIIDEFGGLAGIVTLEDILEEIVGEIEDEYDRPSASIERLSSDRALIDGDVSVHDLNRVLEIELPEDEGVTVNGLIQNRIGTMPKTGDKVEIDGVTLLVERATDREIISVRVIVDQNFESEEASP